MKKRASFLVLFLSLIFSLNLISAQDLAGNLQYGAYQLIDIVQRGISPIIGIFIGGEGYFVFERFLFLLIVLAVVYSVVSKVPKFEDNKAIVWIITISVSLLSTRFLPDYQLIQNILLPYSVLGVALTAAIPILIYFYFVQGFDSSTLRKLLWIFFIVVFLGLWIDRYSELGNLSWIYAITGIAALIFMLADGTIRRILIKQQMSQLGFERRSEFERDIKRKIRLTEEDITNNVVTPSQGEKIKRNLQKQLKAILKS